MLAGPAARLAAVPLCLCKARVQELRLTEPAILVLEDGTVFRGISVGSPGRTLGEVVFNTAMTGYQEILTDPSYFRQIVTLTYPHIGNTGANSDDFEAGRVYAAGLVIRDLPELLSNWRAELPLGEFLRRSKTVAIADIDTRRLTRLIRDQGAQAGCIITGREASVAEGLAAAKKFPGLKGMDLAKLVSTKKAYQWKQGPNWPDRQTVFAKRSSRFHVIALDYGIKRNILRLLTACDARITVMPATSTAVEVMAEMPDGVFLSNGPGDPEPCDYAIETIAALLEIGVPVFGICLGHQLLALASGAKTEKMKFGHHGANHPVVDLETGRVMITSQNHGFAVAEDSLPDELKATHRSLFDGTLQGIARTDCPAFSFQGHPEASPGPHDVAPLFDRFVEMMASYKN
jgi:carbamoyl-phosphate synthase small subunit